MFKETDLKTRLNKFFPNIVQLLKETMLGTGVWKKKYMLLSEFLENDCKNYLFAFWNYEFSKCRLQIEIKCIFY